MFYLYVLQNKTTGETYIGYTNDLRRRVQEHRWRKATLVYYEAYKDEKDARRRERMLKQRGQAVRRLKERIENSLS